MDHVVTATLNSGTGLSEDRFVNSWCVQNWNGEEEFLLDAVSSFYLNTQGGAGALVPMYEFLSGVIDNSAGQGLTLRCFDITAHKDGSPHGSATFEKSYTVPVPSSVGDDLPSEVAACITLEAIGRDTALVEVPDGTDPGTSVDRPKQRRTGRIYFGPLNTNAVELVGGIVRVSNSFRDTARAAVQGMASNLDLGIAGARLAVWSRADAVTIQVEAVSVDNAVDIIRSRGEKPSLRERSVITI